MYKTRVVSNYEECRFLWKTIYPNENIFDLWETRECFAKIYRRECHFIVTEKDNRIMGLLPLVLQEETNTYVFFPGETWNDKTWLEQNKIIAYDTHALQSLLDNIPNNAFLRYLTPLSLSTGNYNMCLDETGYLFFPEKYNFLIENYMLEFSSKSRKRLQLQIDQFLHMGAYLRFNQISDIEEMFKMNIEKFGESSYFKAQLFRDSFKLLLNWLYKNKILKITTVIIEDKIAAIDVGSVWQSGYTVLAGSTNPEFKGIAKFINFFHIDWACKQHLKYVDFLCGDFGWKNMFHLTPRNLYKINIYKQGQKIAG